jgi:hypothetical protein
MVTVGLGDGVTVIVGLGDGLGVRLELGVGLAVTLELGVGLGSVPWPVTPVRSVELEPLPSTRTDFEQAVERTMSKLKLTKDNIFITALSLF